MNVNGRWYPGPQKHFQLVVASRRAALSGNASLITTFSSYYYVAPIALWLIERNFGWARDAMLHICKFEINE